jgi:hypothetical protein
LRDGARLVHIRSRSDTDTLTEAMAEDISMNKEEALSEIQRLAYAILNESEEPAIRIRLLRDIFGCSDQE